MSETGVIPDLESQLVAAKWHLAEARAEIETLRAQLSEWATRCGAAETEARELREGRATWTVGDDGVRRLVVRRVVEAEAGRVVSSDRVLWSVVYDGAFAEGTLTDERRERAMDRAQRAVEAVAGVRP